MAVYQPLRRRDERFDYTCTNGVGTFPIGYCHVYQELKPDDGLFDQAMCDRENARTLPFREKYHGKGHATAEEAEACYRQYQLDQHLEFDDGATASEQRRCGICQQWTAGMARIAGNEWRHWHLCSVHRTRESVEKLWGEA